MRDVVIGTQDTIRAGGCKSIYHTLAECGIPELLRRELRGARACKTVRRTDGQMDGHTNRRTVRTCSRKGMRTRKRRTEQIQGEPDVEKGKGPEQESRVIIICTFKLSLPRCRYDGRCQLSGHYLLLRLVLVLYSVPTRTSILAYIFHAITPSCLQSSISSEFPLGVNQVHAVCTPYGSRRGVLQLHSTSTPEY